METENKMKFKFISVFVVITITICGFVIFSYTNSAETEQVIKTKEEIVFEVNDTPYIEEEIVEEEIIEETIEEPYYEEVEPNYEYEYIQKSWEENGDGLTASKGVNYHNGRKETYYSSNVLYHYRTPEWTVDEYGVYRDSDGYVVVAASDLDQGSEVDTSFGKGKVYDSGCAAGTTDIYTNW